VSSTNPGDVDDLLVAAGRGDARAFELFYDQVAGTVLNRVRVLLNDPAWAEDVTHDALVEVWRTAGSFSPGRCDAVSWSAALAERRASERLTSAPVRESGGGTRTGCVPAVVDGLARLSHDQREVFLRVQRQGQTYLAVAKAMDISAAAVRSLACEAVTLLRDVLADEGTDPPSRPCDSVG